MTSVCMYMGMCVYVHACGRVCMLLEGIHVYIYANMILLKDVSYKNGKQCCFRCVSVK